MVYMGRLMRDGIKSINDTCGHAGALAGMEKKSVEATLFMQKRSFKVILSKNDSGGFTVTVPSLPG